MPLVGGDDGFGVLDDVDAAAAAADGLGAAGRDGEQNSQRSELRCEQHASHSEILPMATSLLGMGIAKLCARFTP